MASGGVGEVIGDQGGQLDERFPGGWGQAVEIDFGAFGEVGS